jgi:hypothetical protein
MVRTSYSSNEKHQHSEEYRPFLFYFDLRKVQFSPEVSHARGACCGAGATTRLPIEFPGELQSGQGLPPRGRGWALRSWGGHWLRAAVRAWCDHVLSICVACEWVGGAIDKAAVFLFKLNICATFKTLHSYFRQKSFSDESSYAMFWVLWYVFRVLYDDAQHVHITRQHSTAHVTCFKSIAKHYKTTENITARVS